MQKLFKTKKGFTLIEILIVVAIIGILATIVTVSMRQASDRGKSTKIISAIVQVRSIADDLYLQNTDGYTDLCDALTSGLDISNEDLKTINDDVIEYADTGNTIACHSTNYHFCVSVQLVGESAKYFCIDHSGTNVQSATKICDTSNIGCKTP